MTTQSMLCERVRHHTSEHLSVPVFSSPPSYFTLAKARAKWGGDCWYSSQRTYFLVYWQLNDLSLGFNNYIFNLKHMFNWTLPVCDSGNLSDIRPVWVAGVTFCIACHVLLHAVSSYVLSRACWDAVLWALVLEPCTTLLSNLVASTSPSSTVKRG